MIRRLRERGGPAGRTRDRKALHPGIEAVEPRLLLDGAAASVVGKQVADVADLVLKAAAAPEGVWTVGETTVTYTLTITNNGDIPAEGVTLFDTLLQDVTFLGASDGTYDPATQTLTASLGTLDPSATTQVTLMVRPEEVGNLLSSVSVWTSTPEETTDNNVAATFNQVIPVFVGPSAPINQVGPAPVVTAVRRLGYHNAPTAFTVTFSQPMNATTVQRSGNYQINVSIENDRLDDSTNFPVGILFAGYNAATRTVFLLPSRRIALNDPVELTINGNIAGLTNADGVPLDGNGDGRPGGIYTTVLDGFTTRPPRPLPPPPLRPVHPIPPATPAQRLHIERSAAILTARLQLASRVLPRLLAGL